jgi:hypothetical protein
LFCVVVRLILRPLAGRSARTPSFFPTSIPLIFSLFISHCTKPPSALCRPGGRPTPSRAFLRSSLTGLWGEDPRPPGPRAFASPTSRSIRERPSVRSLSGRTETRNPRS